MSGAHKSWCLLELVALKPSGEMLTRRISAGQTALGMGAVNGSATSMFNDHVKPEKQDIVFP